MRSSPPKAPAAVVWPMPKIVELTGLSPATIRSTLGRLQTARSRGWWPVGGWLPSAADGSLDDPASNARPGGRPRSRRLYSSRAAREGRASLSSPESLPAPHRARRPVAMPIGNGRRASAGCPLPDHNKHLPRRLTAQLIRSPVYTSYDGASAFAGWIGADDVHGQEHHEEQRDHDEP